MIQKVCCLILSLLLAQSIVFASDSILKRIGGQGEVDFVVVSVALAKDPQALKKAAKSYADKNRKEWCKILIWSDSRKAARSFPMTDAQLNSQTAQYERNTATGLERLRLFKNGSVIKDL